MNLLLQNTDRTWKTPSLPFRCLLLCAALGVLFGPTAFAQDQLLAEIRHIYPRELRTDGFVLDKPQQVYLSAVVPKGEKKQVEMGDAWVLNTETREVVWQFEGRAGSKVPGNAIRMSKVYVIMGKR